MQVACLSKANVVRNLQVESFFKETSHAILEVNYREWLAQKVRGWHRLHMHGR